MLLLKPTGHKKLDEEAERELHRILSLPIKGKEAWKMILEMQAKLKKKYPNDYPSQRDNKNL